MILRSAFPLPDVLGCQSELVEDGVALYNAGFDKLNLATFKIGKVCYLFKTRPSQLPASINQAMPKCTINPPQMLCVL
jgi:hypothetical protein